MAQHRRAKSTGEDYEVNLDLKEKSNYFKGNNVNIFAREDR